MWKQKSQRICRKATRTEHKTNIQKVNMRHNSKNGRAKVPSWKKKNKVGAVTLLNFKTFYEAMVTKTM